MKIYTPDGSGAMANAIEQIYPSPILALLIEQTIFTTAEAQIKDYSGGVWHFHSDGTTGFWVPDLPSVHVECENYYSNPYMDTQTFGAGITLLTLNRLVWKFHDNNAAVARRMQDRYEDLHRWAYGDDSPLDIAQLYSYLD